MKDSVLKSKLSTRLREDTESVIVSVNPTTDPLMEAATRVMASYQNANKWLDIIKESLLMDHGCVFFSNYVHDLAHTMPVRFDKFGDILHTADMKIPYPATEYIDHEPTDIQDAFNQINTILHSICMSLSEFVAVSEGNYKKGLAISAENLLEDISSEFTNLNRMARAYVLTNGDNIKFDKWCAQYLNNRGTLLD